MPDFFPRLFEKDFERIGKEQPDARRYLGRVTGIGDPQEFASYALDRLAKNAGTVVFGRRGRLVHRLYRLLPGPAISATASDFAREKKKVLGR